MIVVEDSNYLAKSIKDFLEADGHDVVAMGEDGFEGVALYSEHKPDLMLLDITMPNKDGRECLAEVLEADPDARVLMVSGSVKELSVIMECLTLGARGYVEKPLKFADDQFCDEFRSTIAKALVE